MYAESRGSGRRDYLQCTAMRKAPASASQCLRCGRCELHCPQHIPIREELRRAARELETPVYRAARWGIQRLRLW